MILFGLQKQVLWRAIRRGGNWNGKSRRIHFLVGKAFWPAISAFTGVTVSNPGPSRSSSHLVPHELLQHRRVPRDLHGLPEYLWVVEHVVDLGVPVHELLHLGVGLDQGAHDLGVGHQALGQGGIHDGPEKEKNVSSISPYLDTSFVVSIYAKSRREVSPSSVFVAWVCKQC